MDIINEALRSASNKVAENPSAKKIFLSAILIAYLLVKMRAINTRSARLALSFSSYPSFSFRSRVPLEVL